MLFLGSQTTYLHYIFGVPMVSQWGLGRIDKLDEDYVVLIAMARGEVNRAGFGAGWAFCPGNGESDMALGYIFVAETYSF